jgi:hypothetical protein
VDDEGRRDQTERSLGHLRNAIATVERVLAANRALAERPDHPAATDGRVTEAERELVVLRQEVAALEAGDIAAALKIARRFRTGKQ